MNKINYQKQLESLLNVWSESGRVPTLLLHSCCAPCSSYVLEYLSRYFYITVFYYNPNIFPEQEYKKRVDEQKRLIEMMDFEHEVSFLEGRYDPARFFEMSKGMEKLPEGGERCFACYRMRLGEAAAAAAADGFEYFTTTLSISPLKDAQKINEIGAEVSQKHGVAYLYSDFKKKNGYRRSVELSREYSLYRQNFCGCIYSREQEGRPPAALKQEK